jgi:hypothetical protein
VVRDRDVGGVVYVFVAVLALPTLAATTCAIAASTVTADPDVRVVRDFLSALVFLIERAAAVPKWRVVLHGVGFRHAQRRAVVVRS